MPTFRFVLLALGLTLLPLAARADEKQNAQAASDLAALSAKVPHFAVLPLPATGAVNLSVGQSLTVDDLRGVALDDNPPQLGPLVTPYDASQTDDYPPGQAPYVSPRLQPFRLKYFNCELNYGGWHNLGMQEYDATHGFNILYPYTRTLEQRSRMPAGTKWLKWGGFVNWDEWMPKHNIPAGRFDLLAGHDLVAELIDSGLFQPTDAPSENPANWDYLMIDMEHGWLSPEALRKQDWYPQTGTPQEQAAFEKRYYDGYAQTFIAPCEVARQRGYKNVSVYGWQPFAKAWYGLDTLHLDPATYWPWQRAGQQIYAAPALSILNPDVYVFYWVPQNVSFTLTQIDLCRQLMATAPQQKPIRPYYWTLLHGGDASYHWWSQQPVPTEDARAWTALCFFTGCDGFDLWNWSDVGNHQKPRPLKYKVGDETKYSDVEVKEPFRAFPEAAANDNEQATDFERYDFIHVVQVDDPTGVVMFQKIDKANPKGVAPGSPVYAMPQDQLIPHLRPEAEAMQGVVEGMALIKPLEYLLKFGEVKIDVSSLDQFNKNLPIVRRVKMGPYHVLITYDPRCIYEGTEGRQIELQNFDGHPGLTVRLPADFDTRVWVLKEQ